MTRHSPPGSVHSHDTPPPGIPAERVEELSDRVHLYTSDGEQTLQQVHTLGIPLESAVVRRSTLEDVFLRITGRGLVE